LCLQGHSFSPFSSALETLQKQLGFASALLFILIILFIFLICSCYYTLIRYTFKSISLLRRAMTHASFSEENNKAFSVLGATIIETSVSFNLLLKDVDISAKELNRRLSLISNVDSSCAVDAMRLGLHKVVRVSPKTNSSSTAVVCGAFRSIFGAISLDTSSSEAAGNVFLTVHGRDLGFSMAMWNVGLTFRTHVCVSFWRYFLMAFVVVVCSN